MDENTPNKTREEMVAEMGEEAVAKIEAEAIPVEEVDETTPGVVSEQPDEETDEKDTI